MLKYIGVSIVVAAVAEMLFVRRAGLLQIAFSIVTGLIIVWLGMASAC